MVQVLHLSNGDMLNRRLQEDNSRVTYLLKSGMSDEELIDNAYLWCLARHPTPREREGFLELLQESQSAGETREATEDLFWALMTSREFLFQH